MFTNSVLKELTQIATPLNASLRDVLGTYMQLPGLEMNRANRAEGLLGLGSGAQTEPSTEQLEMQVTNA